MRLCESQEYGRRFLVLVLPEVERAAIAARAAFLEAGKEPAAADAFLAAEVKKCSIVLRMPR